ncbi:MAG: NADP-dependent malic enzyme [Acidaminococcales bacterium]|jgi:malate dehydrogenase (oxaloacetate-decarboxylating)|nr:NADP-dependent malic enzyme [Acidaminococcales bacterium]
MGLKEDALRYHAEHTGILGVASKVKLTNREELGLAYTPGVAEPCKVIKEDPEQSFALTCRGNMIAVISDGTRVLGLGDIGAVAAMPVMEGKAVLFKSFADVDAVPICVDSKDPEEIIRTVRLLQPSFAGINLEDFSSPKCYDIEDRLKEIMDIPVFHDDQHGTAIAVLSGVVAGLRFVRKDLKTARVVVNGCGAAGSAVARLLVRMGAENVLSVDSCGILYDGMDAGLNRIQLEVAKNTNKGKIKGDLVTAAKGADVLIGLSGPRLFTKGLMQTMNKGAVVFGCANPVPEIDYDEAKAAGVKVAGTGLSVHPNQINNVMVFPGLFRGALDVRARRVTEEMKIAAVYALANLVDEKELREDYVVADAFDPRVAPTLAAAVAKAAAEQGVARFKVDAREVYDNTLARVKKLRGE